MIWCGFSNPSAFSSRKSSALLISATMFFIPCSVLELKMHNSVPPPCSPYFLEHSDQWMQQGPASPSKVMMQKPNRHFGQNAKKGPKRAKKTRFFGHFSGNCKFHNKSFHTLHSCIKTHSLPNFCSTWNTGSIFSEIHPFKLS